MIRLLVQNLKLRKRKGLDKPVFLLVSLTLAIMFLVAYFTATQGWIQDIGGQFNNVVSEQATEAQQ